MLQQLLLTVCTDMEVQALDAVDVLDVEGEGSLLAEDARKQPQEAMLPLQMKLQEVTPPLQMMFLSMPKRNLVAMLMVLLLTVVTQL